MSLPTRISLTRRYRFAAAHVLRSNALSDAENERIYGKCANPGGHGHNYGLEVTVTGPIDHESGELVSLEWLDATVEGAVIARLDHRLLNDDPWFADRVPTAENIVHFARETLGEAFRSEPGLELERIGLHETRRNTFESGAL